MATATKKDLMNAEEFFDWTCRPENIGRSFELVDGEVVEMPPPSDLHGTVCGLFSRILGNFAFDRGRGRVTTNDSGLVVQRSPDTTRGVDVMFYDEVPAYDEISRKYAKELPVLAVEVISPSDRWTEINKRITQYLKKGIPIVWIVDPEAKSVAVYRPNLQHELLTESDEITGNGVLPDFRCRVADLFALAGAAKAQP